MLRLREIFRNAMLVEDFHNELLRLAHSAELRDGHDESKRRKQGPIRTVFAFVPALREGGVRGEA